MNINRRHFLGASLAASSLVIAPRAFAMPKLADRPALLPQALAALDSHRSQITKRDMLGLVDFGVHSREFRFSLVDVANGRIAGSYLVAHGRGSDPSHTGWLRRFSNQPGSNASSRGSFLTGETYYGKHARSRRLHGLDQANNLAFQRAIVIHGASYVDRDVVHRQGQTGRSLGCFAVEQRVIGEVLDRLGPGRLLFASK